MPYAYQYPALRSSLIALKAFWASVLLFFVLIHSPAPVQAEEPVELSGKYKGCNVILIILDALRPDHLSCYGYSGKTSPNIDALGDKGVVFSNAFSTASYTMPGVASLFTSLYPYSHNMIDVFKDRMPDKVLTLAQILNDQGYNTVWFGALGEAHTGAAKGLLNGFKEKLNLQYNPVVTTTGDFNRVCRWINKNSRSKFFITVHSYFTHEQTFPFFRGDNEFSRLVSDELKNELDDLWQKWSAEWIMNTNIFIDSEEERNKSVRNRQLWADASMNFGRNLNEGKLQQMLFLLDSAIYEADKNLVGGIIAELKAQGINDKTIIVITADHGNEYKEHGLMGHGSQLYDESIHVPLVYYLPGLNNGIRIDSLVKSIDTLPTVLDLLAIPVPAQAQGISLIGLLEDKRHLPVNEFVFSQGVNGIFSIRSDKWKYIRGVTYLPNGRQGVFEHLFDLQNDKSEKEDQIGSRPEIARELRSRLARWQKTLVRYNSGKSEFPPEVTQEMRERIRKTGYW